MKSYRGQFLKSYAVINTNRSKFLVLNRTFIKTLTNTNQQ